MFISQVIFETELGNEETLRRIMQKKKEDTSDVVGLQSSECWWKDSTNSVQFALVTKWDNKEAFQTWLKQSHAGGHRKPDTDGKPTISKTVYQFESVTDLP